ncbi:hypothetical protein CY658_03040 [Variovorax sp. RO1]|uniref:GIY-YIG nuclease family protein n=1 Tax=Variovorax sp. RO1 TaxID=2066034 RepID=UPI000C717582|nr:GIY-YIG nuclease family protein [Variovorax sp. RO1]PLC06038.1 hypothetical protein CY658_03040 [Variovorax sp. RO1]
MAFHAPFEIDIIDALSGQLLAALDTLTLAPLDVAHIAQVESQQGIYVLYKQGITVYVGKADNLRSRLGDHLKKLTGRRNVVLSELAFKCLYVHKNWTALAPEASLIVHYKSLNVGLCAWNGTGFGPHDPGRDRETTNKHPEGFDSLHPIIDDLPCTWVAPRVWNARELLLSLKDNLPYLLRFQVEGHYRNGHADYNNVDVSVPTAAMPAKALLGLIASALPDWQATAFVSHMILYREFRTYSFGVVL